MSKIVLAQYKSMEDLPEAAFCCENAKAMSLKGQGDVIKVDISTVYVSNGRCPYCLKVYVGKAANVVGEEGKGALLDFWDMNEGEVAA